MKKLLPWIAIVMVLAGIAAGVLLFLQKTDIHGGNAPKFSKLSYAEVTYPQRAMCLAPFDCTDYAYPTYKYSAKGLQKDIAEDVIGTLANKGYKLQSNYGDPVICYGSAGDRYYFENGDKILELAFYAEEKLPDVNTTAVGCNRPDANYRVELSVVP